MSAFEGQRAGETHARKAGTLTDEFSRDRCDIT
jgi:hypothetical protein